MNTSKTFEIRDINDTKRLAETLVGGASFPGCIELVGDVGAGKTTLTREIVKALGSQDEVQSPSFTVSLVYELPDDRQVHHYDFYRLSDPGVVAYELQESVTDQHVLTIIEWADTVESVLPDSRTTVKLSFQADGSRIAEITK